MRYKYFPSILLLLLAAVYDLIGEARGGGLESLQHGPERKVSHTVGSDSVWRSQGSAGARKRCAKEVPGIPTGMARAEVFKVRMHVR